jgi:hypothetical protein
LIQGRSWFKEDRGTYELGRTITSQGTTTPKFLALALSRQVALRALKVCIIVGAILALINHGGAILELNIDTQRLLQIALTYLVPYGVSTYSSVRAIQAHEQTHT